ncbi:MAG TPA: DUF6295 family protein [Acidimicrobiales bacterium]|nr:DUF6295 family protein [Acidimicrobiales bacterium]
MQGCSGKGREGWFPLMSASVYYDHPVHAPADHTVNVDFLNPEAGPGARVAVEMDPRRARELARAILAAADAADQFAGPPPLQAANSRA